MCRPSSCARAGARAAARQATATTIATIVILRTSTSPTETGRLSDDERRRRLAERAEPEQRDRSAAGTRPRTSRRASRRATGSAAAGRRARSMTSSARSTTAKQSTMPAHAGQSHSDDERERERAGHHELPVREVDEPEHAEDEADPDRHQRVDGPEARSRRRRSATFERCRRARSREVRGHHPLRVAGVVGRRASGGARRSRAGTCDRRARRCAARAARRAARRCPRSRIAASASNTTSTIFGASPSDGSSSSRTSGSATSARAIASCCCWPPESAPA